MCIYIYTHTPETTGSWSNKMTVGSWNHQMVGGSSHPEYVWFWLVASKFSVKPPKQIETMFAIHKGFYMLDYRDLHSSLNFYKHNTTPYNTTSGQSAEIKNLAAPEVY